MTRRADEVRADDQAGRGRRLLRLVVVVGGAAAAAFAVREAARRSGTQMHRVENIRGGRIGVAPEVDRTDVAATDDGSGQPQQGP